MKKKFPYALNSLHWDPEHKTNTENKYCYCGKNYKNEKPVIQCTECKQWFHGDCINCLSKPLLFGDIFGEFHCSVCTKEAEKYERKSLSWVTIVHWVIYHLIRKAQIDDAKKPKKDQREHYYFRWKEDVCAFIDDYWDYLVPEKQRSLTWNNTIASVLSTHSDIFLSGYEKFHQTAWWTLYKIEPPSKEKRLKPSMKQKPKLKKPLKRSRGEESTTEKPKKSLKQQKDDDIAQVKTEPQEDLMDLSSLSELSSAEEIFDSDNEINTKDEAEKTRQKKPLKSTKKESALNNAKPKAKLNEKKAEKEDNEEDADAAQSDVVDTKNKEKEKEKEKEVEETELEKTKETQIEKTKETQIEKTKETQIEKTKEAIEETEAEIEPKTVQEKDDSIETTKAIEEPSKDQNVDQLNASKEMIPPTSDTIDIADVQTNDNQTQPSKANTDTIIIKEEEESQDLLESVKPPTQHNTQKNNTTLTSNLTQQNEWLLLQKLEHSSRKLPFAAKRYKRKLAVRRLKRNLGIKLFDMDHQVVHYLRTSKASPEAISKNTTILPASNQIINLNPSSQHLDTALLEKITYTPYSSSFASRLYGSIRHRNTITRDEPWLSSWNGRKLRPFIRRDFESRPPRMKLLNQIKACNGKPCKKLSEVALQNESIDYVYFQKEHLLQVNQMLCRSFWEGIDVSESLLYPEFSIVALYKRKVIACAFMTPEAYITYIAVEIGWENANIGQFMLYHLFQTSISKDVTLHVSANNNAMILYQKFGFKPEEFVVNFYDKYLPSDSPYSKNAFFMRLRR